MYKKDLEDFMESLFQVGCVKFGDNLISSGLKSPVFFDLRILVSHPQLLHQAAKFIQKYIEDNKLEFDVICGVPYGAFAVATALSLKSEKPMVFKRKEIKDYGYGVKKIVEGSYREGDACLVIEDVVVFGTSIIEITGCLREYKLNVKDVITLLDREQGGPANINKHNVNFHSIIKASDLLAFLHRKGKISLDTMNETIDFLKKNTYEALVQSQHINVDKNAATN